MGLTIEDVRRLALALPGVEEGPCYGTPGFRVGKKLFARLREDETSLMVKVGFEEREQLIASDPVRFFTTDHYRNYPSVLLRLPEAAPEDLAPLLAHAWRQVAPKKLLAQGPAAP